MLWCSFTVDSPTCFGVWPPVTQEVAAGGRVVSVRSGVNGWAASCWALPGQLLEDPLVCFPAHSSSTLCPERCQGNTTDLLKHTSQCWTWNSDCVFWSDSVGAEPAGAERQLCCVEVQEVVKEELRRCRSVSVRCCHDNARETQREARWKTKDASVSVQLALKISLKENSLN